MRMSRQIPFRKLKVVIMFCACLFTMFVLWSSTGHKPGIYTIPSNKYYEGILRHEETFKMELKTQSKKQDEFVCNEIVPFKNISSGTISTYDLPLETDYSLDSDGRYKLPEEVLQAKSTDDEIQVILVPFSHTDPGYGQTVENYYTGSTKHVLDNMVDFLTKHRNMTFQWVETVFLERWFRDITEETKQKVRKLISQGQLEVVLGGWVMPDEAITHYAPVVDQLIEGHQWLIENLGVFPVNAWINDPFGYSSTMPYLWKSSGIQNMVILRIHQAIKHTLMRKRSLDFMWRPYWDSEGRNDILCNLMPYTEYWNSKVCGPDSRVCKKFNFLHLRSYNQDNVKPVSQDNIESLATELYKAYTFTASLYKYNSLIIFLGEDNSYSTTQSWADTYENYGKLMTYINSKSEWKMKIKFGTIKDYFENIRKEEKTKLQSAFPVLSGDFFPYSEKENDYWTGYFTTRPWIKRLTREVEPLVRAGDKFSVILYNTCIVSKGCTGIKDVYSSILSELRSARRHVGIFQHHDGITGTSLPFVVNDYELRLMSAFKSAQKALTLAVSLIVSDANVKEQFALGDNNDKLGARNILTPKIYRLKNRKLKLYVVNPLEKARKGVVSFYTDKNELTISDVISHQIGEPTSSRFKRFNLVTIFVDLSPFEIKMVQVEAKGDGTNRSPYFEDTVKSSGDSTEIITIENKYMKVEFYSINGSLKSIADSSGRKTDITCSFLKYKPVKSGAYLFGPGGPAKPITELPQPEVSVSTGPVHSQVTVSYKSGFTQRWILYHTDDITGHTLHVRQEITLELEPRLVESEVILRFKTDIDNKDLFFTDQNGFQLIGRKNNKDRPIETNYYPITTMAILEDSTKRLTLHSAQSHGVASLEDGWLEVMLDRNMNHDDQKGLGMGAPERVASLSEFMLQIEYKNVPSKIQEVRYTHESVSSIILNEQLQNKLQLFSVEQHNDKFIHGFELGQKPLPCDVSIVGLRNLVTNDLDYTGTSLVVHRKPVHCEFPTNVSTCSLSNGPLTLNDVRFGLDTNVLENNVTETSLSHIHRIGKTKLSDDVRPKVNEMRAFLLKPEPP
ncbi:alpha-mannosidase 2x-like [Mercenaria mercenaria]|uniref:alpha-mannosidase 2x-like n=1 Tax=Mercenaria mercenaria TaxID=6596 RepID=UPI00234E98E9|nr:alpha-mannosidase 2x-like [Mercenaria mercenaria]XP_045199324.2 alpha-mannosidase 2x-like [Mercenaria mercenaria]